MKKSNEVAIIDNKQTKVSAKTEVSKEVKIAQRTPKVYTIAQGHRPETKDGKIEVAFNEHTETFVQAIEESLAAGNTTIARAELLTKAEKLGLYNKTSKSSPSYILSWWMKSLKSLGYIVS